MKKLREFWEWIDGLLVFLLIMIVLCVVALWYLVGQLAPGSGEDPGLYLLGGVIVGILLFKK